MKKYKEITEQSRVLNIGDIRGISGGEITIPIARDEREEFGKRPMINTSGGVYVGGDVRIGGGKFVGRVTPSDIPGSSIARFYNVISGSSNVDAISKALDDLRKAFEEAPDTAQKKAAERVVGRLQQEVDKGEQADKAEIEQWLDVIMMMGPDV